MCIHDLVVASSKTRYISRKDLQYVFGGDAKLKTCYGKHPIDSVLIANDNLPRNAWNLLLKLKETKMGWFAVQKLKLQQRCWTD